MLESEVLLRELDIKFFKWLMKEEFLKNRWLLLEKGSKTSERTTLFLTALSTGSLKLYFIG